MNVLIIEDEQLAAERLKKLIALVDSKIEVVAVLDSIEKSIDWFKNQAHPDLIFLDIQLSDGLSFNIFKEVEVQRPIVFTTAYDEYALKAFEVNSIDYLLKPIDTEKLKISIEKFKQIRKNFQTGDSTIDINKLFAEFSVKKQIYKTRFLIHKSDSLFVVDTNQIAYFYSEQKVTFIVCKDNQKHILNDSLDTVASQLDPSLFYRVNRQYIISIDSIAKIHNHFNYKLKLELLPKTEDDNVIVSRTKVGAFKDWLSR